MLNRGQDYDSSMIRLQGNGERMRTWRERGKEEREEMEREGNERE